MLILVVLDLSTTRYTESLVDSSITSLQSSPFLGFVYLTLLYVLFTVFFIPGSLLTLGAGFAFTQASGSTAYGILLGTLSVLAGATTGSVLAFLLARYMFKSVVERWIMKTSNVKKGEVSNIRRYFTLLSTTMSTSSGFKVMFLLRLSPLVPFNALNYIAGAATGISLWDYTKALVGIVPGTVLFVYLGSTAGSLATAGEGGGTVKVIFLIVGGILGFVGLGIVGKKARDELAKEEREREEKEVAEP